MAGTPLRAEDLPPVIDRGDAAELYVDGYQGVTVANGVVKINLYTVRLNAEKGQAERVIVKRLAMPLLSLVAMHSALGALMQDLEREGVIAATSGDQNA